MAEYSYIPVQTVAANANVLFTDTIVGCNRGIVMHRAGSGLFNLRGATNCQCRARYKIYFNGNIAVPVDETPEAISLAIALEGEPLGATVMTVTSAIAERYFNVSASTFIDVPAGCCQSVTIKNISAIPVDVRNANIIIERVA